jgi:hypothetical protein
MAGMRRCGFLRPAAERPLCARGRRCAGAAALRSASSRASSEPPAAAARCWQVWLLASRRTFTCSSSKQKQKTKGKEVARTAPLTVFFSSCCRPPVRFLPQRHLRAGLRHERHPANHLCQQVLRCVVCVRVSCLSVCPFSRAVTRWQWCCVRSVAQCCVIDKVWVRESWVLQSVLSVRVVIERHGCVVSAHTWKGRVYETLCSP